ncbi:response regulator transcription factor [Chitinophaga sp. Mgbs1]|uniref:Response regulator transcription factor n=1 Tax=Chitinophaga solisilvae TaxID=1233460 RepID=A0A3S1DM69_9BACT|nr:response regulator transcription factor [Chitinophaga solisilvae]
MKIKCIIVDDEPLAREGMMMLVKDYSFLEVTGVCGSAMQANSLMAQDKPDLLFLDIQMPGIMGLDFVRSLTNPPMIIITTAYPNFALEGFELNVLDYLVKPITPERFLTAVNRARTLMESRKSETGNTVEDYFFIRSGNGFEKISFQEILYIEGCENYCSIHTAGGKYMTLTTMRSLEEQLPSGRFLRIQKSFIVAIDKIHSLNGNILKIGTRELPVSKNYKAALLELIDRKLIRK